MTNSNTPQLSLPFTLEERDKKDYQPQFFQSLDDLIIIESSIETLKRKDWNQKYDFYTSEESSDDFIVLDHNNKKLIIFLNQFRRSSDKLTIGAQIIKHWLLGGTMSNPIPDSIKISLTTKELQLFFKGTQEEIGQFQTDHGFEANSKSIGWKLYHYPAKYFNQKNIIGDYITKVFGKQIEKYNDYEQRISYGIVSQAYHLRSDKLKLRGFLENFLDERGFKVDKPYEFNDLSRNGEPILLWVNKNYIDGQEIKSVVGMNFGYDNGLSSFRLALGVYFEDDDLLFPQINNIVFRKYYNENKTLKEAMSHTFQSWTHHKNFDQIEVVTKTFFEKHYSIIYDNMVKIINNSKKRPYRLDQSKRILTHTHSNVFEGDKEKLLELHEKHLDNNVASHFTHFKIWNDLAKSISDDRYKKSLAEFVASCVVGQK